ncbi:MAG TPA: ATP-binding cassette domain-containing protein [Solirubrobacterales bacterium]|jgi:putative ABC transport system ATP-binding protein|nr:ATP-binding cassette domain-containing protein [Solirubrobacterales bacterium]
MLFELTDVSYSRSAVTVLDGLTARIPRGASCLFGPSGSGKSTTLRLLDRLIDADRGRVLYEGSDVRERDVLALRREVVLVPQLPALAQGTVADNVAYGPRMAGHSFDARTPLELAGLDPALSDRPAGRLSVGERQRVMLARALALQPRVLLLDEPTSALDAVTTAAVEKTLEGLRARTAISVVLVTHSEAQARRLADWVVRIDRGRATGEGPIGEVLGERAGDGEAREGG